MRKIYTLLTIIGLLSGSNSILIGQTIDYNSLENYPSKLPGFSDFFKQSQNQYNRNTDNCLKVDFSFHLAENGCSVVFQDLTKGTPDAWSNWDFGDGSLISIESLTTEKFFNGNGCYDVTLLKNWEGKFYKKTKQVCLDLCVEDKANLLECRIFGTDLIKRGHTFNLKASGYGTGPFGYSWAASTDHLTKIGENGNTVTYLVNETAANDATDVVVLEVFDSFGNKSKCTHPLTVAGGFPVYDACITGSMRPNTPLQFWSYLDINNTTGYVQYQKTVLDSNDIEILSSPWKYNYVHGTCDSIEQICLENGTYKLIAKAKDRYGQYEISRYFTIGNPIYEPLDPALKLNFLEPSDGKLQNGNLTSVLKFEGKWPFPEIQECKKIFLRDIKLKNLSTNELIVINDHIPINNWQEEEINLSIPCGWIGTIQIDATAYSAKNCNDQNLDNQSSFDPNEAYQLPTLFIESLPFYSRQLNLQWVGDKESKCLETIEVNTKVGCGPFSYEWEFYDDETKEKIENFATFQDNKAILDFNHVFFAERREKIFYQFYVIVKVTDSMGRSSATQKTFQSYLPFFVENSIEKTLCENSKVVLDNLYKAGSGNVEIKWISGDTDHIHYDSQINEYIFQAPSTARNTDFFDYKCEVKDLDCGITKILNLRITIEPISILAQDEYKICNDRSGYKTFKPIVTGGTGKYSYRWNNGHYLDSSSDKNPVVRFRENQTKSMEFILKVFDNQGCSASQKFVAMPSEGELDNEWSINVSDKILCYGSKNEIPVKIEGLKYDSENVTMEWKNIGWRKPIKTKSLSLGPEITQRPGSHKIDLIVTDTLFGCKKVEELEFTVTEPIRYWGYETETRAIMKGGSNYDYNDLWKSAPDRNIIESPDSTINLNFEFIPNLASITSRNSINIPSSAKVDPFEAANEDIVMRVSNQFGCYVDVATNRYIVYTNEPQIEIFPDDSKSTTETNNIKLKVVVTVDVEKNAHLMPNSILLPWRQKSMDRGAQSITSSTDTLFHSSNVGRYEGFVTLNSQPNSNLYDRTYEFVSSLDPSKQINDQEKPWDKADFMRNSTTADGIFVFNASRKLEEIKSFDTQSQPQVFEMMIYPNPTVGVLNVNISNKSNEANASTYGLDVKDLLGNTVISIFQNELLSSQKSDYQIDVSHLVAGSYLLSLTDARGQTSENKIFFKF